MPETQVFTVNSQSLRPLKSLLLLIFYRKQAKKTGIFVRFSIVGGGQDFNDYARDPCGFAIKFYTQQGNYDMVGNNTLVFFLRDPIKFPDFVHS